MSRGSWVVGGESWALGRGWVSRVSLVTARVCLKITQDLLHGKLVQNEKNQCD